MRRLLAMVGPTALRVALVAPLALAAPLALLALAAGCGATPAPPAAPAAPRPPAVATPPTPPTPPAPAVDDRPRFRDQVVDELLAAMAERPVVAVVERFNAIEPVFHLDLGDGLHVAFKPQTRTRPGIWRNDVTAAIVGRQLGLGDRVPPATGRHVPLAVLQPRATDALRPDPDAPHLVYGSVIYWMPVLERSRLSGVKGRERWGRWLDQRFRAPTGDDARRAEMVSSLIVFDYLQANIDRFDHPSNLRVDEHDVLVYRDNNEAWMNGTMSGLWVNRDLLLATQRFSRTVIDGLRATDAAALAAALAPWAAQQRPLLDAAHLAHYARRRQAVLDHVDRLVARHGADRVLPWP